MFLASSRVASETRCTRRPIRFEAFFGVVLLFLFLVPSRAALAQSSAKGTVLPLKTVSDALSEGKLNALSLVVMEQLRKYSQFKVQDIPETDVLELLMEHDCFEPTPACLAKIGEGSNADFVFYTDVVKKPKGFVLNTIFVNVSKRKSEETVVRKTRKEKNLIRHLEKAMRIMFGRPPKMKPRPVRLLVEANVEGGDVSLDGSSLGSLPYKGSIMPGKHTLRIVKRGYENYERTIQVTVGKGYRHRAVLRAKQVKAPPPIIKDVTPVASTTAGAAQPIYKEWWFWTAASAVVLATVTTLIVAYSDDGPSKGGLIFTFDPAQVENDAIFSSP